MILNLKTIKKVYVNLDRDTERRNRFENTLKHLQYTNYERFSARLLPKIRDFNHGCSQSHHDLMKQYQNNLPLFLLEDDAKNTIWYDEYVKDGLKWYKKYGLPNDQSKPSELFSDFFKNDMILCMDIYDAFEGSSN